MKNSQAAMEFLLTYGWALVILITAISAIAFFSDNLFPRCRARGSISLPELYIVDHSIIGNDADDISKNIYSIVVKNSNPGQIVIQGIQLKKNDMVCGDYASVMPLKIGIGDKTRRLTGRITNPDCFGTAGECYDFNADIKYLNTLTGLVHTTPGIIRGSFYPNGSAWSIGGWSVSSISGNILGMHDSGGNDIHFCSNSYPVPSYSTFTEKLPLGLIFWDEPTSCSSIGGVAQVGFSSACGSVPGQLSQAWIHGQWYIDEVYQSHNIYLGGDATYPTSIGGTVENGICLNDNMYFYVNGALVFYGGTSGEDGSDPFVYEPGDEIIRGCGNCGAVDTSAWCIPPVELTTSGFNFAAFNDIDILVEDFCIGGGASHAGGMSGLEVSII